jgi:hypothetical protein
LQRCLCICQGCRARIRSKRGYSCEAARCAPGGSPGTPWQLVGGTVRCHALSRGMWLQSFIRKAISSHHIDATSFHACRWGRTCEGCSFGCGCSGGPICGCRYAGVAFACGENARSLGTICLVRLVQSRWRISVDAERAHVSHKLVRPTSEEHA